MRMGLADPGLQGTDWELLWLWIPSPLAEAVPVMGCGLPMYVRLGS
jgi:hypothetical protein